MFIFAKCVDRNTRIGRRKEVIKRHVEICSCCFHLARCHCNGSCLAKFKRTEECVHVNYNGTSIIASGLYGPSCVGRGIRGVHVTAVQLKHFGKSV